MIGFAYNVPMHQTSEQDFSAPRSPLVFAEPIGHVGLVEVVSALAGVVLISAPSPSYAA